MTPDVATTAVGPDAGSRHRGQRQRQSPKHRLVRAATVAAGSAALLAGLAAVVTWQAREAERRNPPIGRFDGVRLHYLDVGDGPAVVLLHGNSSMVQDFALSILEPLARRYRVGRCLPVARAQHPLRRPRRRSASRRQQ